MSRFDNSFYSNGSAPPELKFHEFRIPTTYRSLIESLKHEIGFDDEETHEIDMMLYYVIQFGGFSIKRTSEQHDLNFLERKPDGGKIKYRPRKKFIQRANSLKFDGFEHISREWWNSHNVGNDSLTTKLNQFYSEEVKLSIPQNLLIGQPLNWGETIRRFESIPFLVPREKAGGRFIHPQRFNYQKLTKNMRELMEVNNEETTESDINAAALRFLYIAGEKNGIEFPREFISPNNDGYSYFTNSGTLSREDTKNLTYAMVYSSSKKERKAVEHKLRQNGDRRNYDMLTHEFSEFFEALDKFKTKFETPHLPIFQEETRFTREVIRRCLESEIIILPIHDSYITTQNRRGDLDKILQETQEELYGEERLLIRTEY